MRSSFVLSSGALVCLLSIHGCKSSDGDPKGEAGEGGATGGTAGASGGSAGGIAGKGGKGGSAGGPNGDAGFGGEGEQAGSGGSDPSTGGTGGSDTAGSGGSDAGESSGGSGVAGESSSGGTAGSDSGTGGSSTGGSSGATARGPLVVEITAKTNPISPDGRALYDVTVGNISSHAVEDVGVLLRIPPGLEFHYAYDAEPNASACGGNIICSPNEEATWNLGSIPAGQTRTITVNPLVLQTVGDGDIVTPLITLSATDLDDRSISKPTQVLTDVDAQLAIGSAADPVIPGQTFGVDIDVGQLGTSPLQNAKVTLTLPAGLTVSSVSDGGTKKSASQAEWSLDTLSIGETLHRSVQVQAKSDAPPGDVLKLIAALTYDGGLEADNTAEYPLSVVAEAQPLQVTLDAVPGPAVPGARLEYTATVSNTSTRALEDITLLWRLATPLEFHYAYDAEPDAGGCNGNIICGGNEETTWNIGSLEAGSSRTLIVAPSVLAATIGDGGLIPAKLSAWASELNQINVYRTVPVHDSPEVELALGTVVDPITPGQSFTYDIQLGQIGGSALENPTLTLDLPQGLTVTDVSDGGTEAVSGRVVWDLADVPVAGYLRRAVIVMADDEILPGTTLSARASLAFDDGGEVDAIADHSVSVVEDPMPLTVEVTPAADSATLGERLLYTTTITNTAARAIDGVTLLLRIPRGVEFHYATDANPDAGGCNGNIVCSEFEETRWTLGAMAAGAVQTVTINPLVAASLTGGSLIIAEQQVTATGMIGVINVQTTLPTHN